MALGLVFALVGCAPSDEAELLRVHAFAPDRLAPGTTLTVEGEGFPVTREGELSLEGECRSPGEPTRRVHVTRPLAATAGDEATTTIDAAFVRALGGRATCRFGGVVRFEGVSGGVVGRFHGVTLDVLPGARDRLASRLSDAERGRHVGERLGLHFDDELPEPFGLRVARVAASSVAARAEVAPGDVVLSIDGIRLSDVADLVPTPGFRRTTLVVRREASGRIESIDVPTFVTAADTHGAAGVGWAIVAALALVVFAFLAPTGRFLSFLAQRPPRDPEATLGWLFGAQESAGTRRARLRAFAIVALGVVGMSAAFAGVAAIARALERDFGIGILLSASLALRMAARVFGEPSGEDEGSYLPFFVASAPLTITVAAIGLLVGTGHLGELHAAQGGLPMRWLVFAQPIAFALFPVFAATALTRVEPRGTRSGLAKVAARAHLMVVSCLGAALFLGGFCSPIVGRADASWLGIAGFVLKAWSLLALGLWARSVTPGAGGQAWKWTVPVSVLGLVASVVWVYCDVPTSVERASGMVLAPFTVLVLAYIAYARVRPEREPTLVLHPFL